MKTLSIIFVFIINYSFAQDNHVDQVVGQWVIVEPRYDWEEIYRMYREKTIEDMLFTNEFIKNQIIGLVESLVLTINENGSVDVSTNLGSVFGSINTNEPQFHETFFYESIIEFGGNLHVVKIMYYRSSDLLIVTGGSGWLEYNKAMTNGVLHFKRLNLNKT